MFFRKRKLIDHDPATLSLEMLSVLQGSLVAKLMLVNKELHHRYQSIADLSAGLQDSDASRSVLLKSAERLVQFNAFLEAELVHITREPDPNVQTSS